VGVTMECYLWQAIQRLFPDRLRYAEQMTLLGMAQGKGSMGNKEFLPKGSILSVFLQDSVATV